MWKWRVILGLVFTISIFFSYHQVFKSPPFNSRICLDCFEEKLCQLPENIQEILSQNYKFLGKGGQFYAFISHDGNYIVKFFRTAKIRDLIWVKNLPIPIFLQPALVTWQDKQARIEKKLLTSCQIASTIMQEQTGIIGIHLSKTNHLNSSIRLEDREGFTRSLLADDVPFLIQRKAELFTASIKQMAQDNDLDEVKKSLTTILDEILFRAKKMIVNNDPFLQKNYGFYNKKPIEIDVGSFSFDSTLRRPACLAKEFYFCSKQLLNFVKNELPELKEWLQEIITEKWQNSLEEE